MTAFPGLVPGNVQIDLLSQILITAPSFPFANVALSFESMNIGMRKGAKLIREVKGTEDVGKRTMVDRVAVKIEAELMQNGLATLLNVYKLSQQNCQARIKTYQGKYYTFVENAAGLAAPDGSSLIPIGFEFTIGTNERSLKINSELEMAVQEWQWLIANAQMDAAHVGETGTAPSPALALTEVGYNRAGYKRNGLQGFSYAGASMGEIGSGSKITLKSTSKKKDHRERPYYRFIEVSGELILLQTGNADQQALSDNLEATDGDLEITTWEGETIKLIDGAVGYEGTTEIGDGKFETKISIKGEIPYNVADATPTTVDIGDTTATELVLDLGIYS
jgi:hypothetical protein